MAGIQPRPGRERLSTLELLNLLSCALDETLIPTID